MINQVQEHLKTVENFTEQDSEAIEAFRIKYAGKKGVLADLFAAFREVPPEEKKEYGLLLNQLKQAVGDKVKDLQSQTSAQQSTNQVTDPFRPAFPIEIGSRHPLSLVRNRIIDIFSQVGFSISEGPEIEDDWHNFTALNLPEYHPARDMQDTFFIDKNPDTLLRTHTSSVQVRYMENNKPPIRTISPGRVFRNEDISKLIR